MTGRRNKLGTPFIDAGNTGNFSDRHTLVYGHALKSGAMFGFLWEYENPNYVSRHPQIILDLTDGRRLTLDVFACSRMEGVRSAIPISFETEASFLSFIDDLHETSAFFSNVKLSSADRIVSFCVVPPNGGGRADARELPHCRREHARPLQRVLGYRRSLVKHQPDDAIVSVTHAA